MDLDGADTDVARIDPEMIGKGSVMGSLPKATPWTGFSSSSHSPSPGSTRFTTASRPRWKLRTPTTASSALPQPPAASPLPVVQAAPSCKPTTSRTSSPQLQAHYQSYKQMWMTCRNCLIAFLFVGCLLVARGSGGIGLTPCPFPSLHLTPRNSWSLVPGATAGLVPFLETATILVLPLYFTTISHLTRPVVLLMLLIAYGTAGASVISMSLNAGVQPENILFYIFALTFVWPIFHYEAQTANSFLNAVLKMRVVLRLCEHSASLRMHAEHIKGGLPA
eukprot:g78023.t1